MPITRIARGPADTWADAGRSIGGGLSALFQGEAVKRQAQIDTERVLADTYYRNQLGNQAGANADRLRYETELAANKLGLQQNALPTAMLELGLPTAKAADFKTRLETGQWGGQYAPPADGMGPTMPPPADDDTVSRLGRNLALMQRMYGTGSNVDQAASASLKGQQERFVDQVASNPKLAPAVGQAYAATAGRPLFNAVGNTGVSFNQFTGQGDGMDTLRKLFSDKTGSEIAENRAQAGSAGASAANSRASADLTAAKLKHFIETGRMPSASDGNSGGLNIGQIRDDIRADYNALYPMDVMRERPGAPSYEDFTRQWLQKNNVPEAEFYGSAGGATPVPRPASGGAVPPQPRATGGTAPKAGDIQDGYRFKGGDPASPGNWEQVRQNSTPATSDAAALDTTITKAQEAIKRGANPASVRQRLADNGITDAMLLDQARAAIAQGKDRDAVQKRLRELGINPRGL